MRNVVFVFALLFLWPGCFSVELPQTYHCSSSRPECPEGHECKGGVCVREGSRLDMAADGPVADRSVPDASSADTPAPDLLAPDGPAPDAAAPDSLMVDAGPPDWLLMPDGCVPTCKHAICSSYLDFCPLNPCACGCDGAQYQCHCLPGPCGNGAVGGNPGQVSCAADLAFVTTYYKPSAATGWTCFAEPKKP